MDNLLLRFEVVMKIAFADFAFFSDAIAGNRRRPEIVKQAQRYGLDLGRGFFRCHVAQPGVAIVQYLYEIRASALIFTPLHDWKPVRKAPVSLARSQ